MTDQPSDRNRDKPSESPAPRWVPPLSIGVIGMLVVGFFILPTVTMGAFFLLFGVLLLGVGAYWCVSTAQLVRRGVSADSVIVGFDERVEDPEEGERKYSIAIGPISWSFGPKEEPRVSFHPRVEFETIDHEKRAFTSDDGSRKPSYRVGEVVRVLYDPARPQVARINKHLWWPILTVIVFGTWFLVPGLWILLVSIHVLPGEIHWE
jgi:hypothetical protein